MMEEMILYIAKSLVDLPDQVQVRRVGPDSSMVFELKVDEKDRGRVIGKGGQTIHAIRTLLKAAAASDQKPVLEVPG